MGITNLTSTSTAISGTNLNNMLHLRIVLLLAALFTGGQSLKCWQTGNSATDMTPLPLPLATSLRSSSVPIVEVQCTNSGDTCMRKWWTVAKVSDVYYSLGCSSAAVKSEEETFKGHREAGPVLLQHGLLQLVQPDLPVRRPPPCCLRLSPRPLAGPDHFCCQS